MSHQGLYEVSCFGSAKKGPAERSDDGDLRAFFSNALTFLTQIGRSTRQSETPIISQAPFSLVVPPLPLARFHRIFRPPSSPRRTRPPLTAPDLTTHTRTETATLDMIPTATQNNEVLKSAQDERSYRHLTLRNQMQASARVSFVPIVKSSLGDLS